MNMHEPSKPPEQGSAGQRSAEHRRDDYRPGVVAMVVALAVVVGIVLKTTTRHHRITTGSPEQATAKSSEPTQALPIQALEPTQASEPTQEEE
jgi:hypothetical protein